MHEKNNTNKRKTEKCGSAHHIFLLVSSTKRAHLCVGQLTLFKFTECINLCIHIWNVLAHHWILLDCVGKLGKGCICRNGRYKCKSLCQLCSRIVFVLIGIVVHLGRSLRSRIHLEYIQKRYVSLSIFLDHIKIDN
jgi:hypothetical protein